MRTIHELLLLILKYYEQSVNGESSAYLGLCHLVDTLCFDNLINSLEYSIIEDYLVKHKPGNVGVYSKNDLDHLFFWKPYLSKPRIEWLYKHIELTKP